MPIEAWYRQIKFARTVLRYFDIWPTKTNVGIIEYGDRTRIRSEINLDGIYMENLEGILGQME